MTDFNLKWCVLILIFDDTVENYKSRKINTIYDIGRNTTEIKKKSSRNFNVLQTYFEPFKMDWTYCEDFKTP